MGIAEFGIQKDAKFLMDYHAPRLYATMGWSVVVHHDAVRLYDPLGVWAAEVTEGQEVVYMACQPEHLAMFLTEARKRATA